MGVTGGTGGGELHAAIGIGSNSTRLLVARVAAGGITPVERSQVVTRLAGYRLSASGQPHLDPAAVQATLDTAARFRERAMVLGAVLRGAVATEAVRASADGPDLVRQLEALLDAPVQVISGEEEAGLGWRAAVSAYDAAGADAPLGVIDIGGGSTDLSTGSSQDPRPRAVLSLQVGGRTAMRRYDLHKPVEPSKTVGIINSLRIEMHDQAAAMAPRPRSALVIGGTAEVIAAVYQAGEGTAPSEETQLDRDWLARKLVRLAAVAPEMRVEMGVPADRADVAVAGGIILLVLLDAWGLQHLRFSERGILDAWLAGWTKDEGRRTM